MYLCIKAASQLTVKGGEKKTEKKPKKKPCDDRTEVYPHNLSQLAAHIS